MISRILGIAITFLTLPLTCRPLHTVSQGWDGEHPGNCVDRTSFTEATAFLNIIFDIITLVIPIPQLLACPEVPIRRKLLTLLAFLLGIFVTACGTLRLTYIVIYSPEQNYTWNFSMVASWTFVEVNAGIICACTPTLWGL
jgi:hypothetical protein